MKFLSFSALALVLLAVESVLAQALGLEITRLEATAALVIFIGVRGTVLEGAFTAFAVGYLLDVFTGRPTGLYPFLAMVNFVGAKLISQVMDGRSLLGFSAFVAVGSAAQALLALFFTWLTSRSLVGHAFSLRGLPLLVVFAVLVGALLYPWLKKLEPGEARQDPGALRV